MVVSTIVAVKSHEDQAERIERGHKHRQQHRNIGIAGTGDLAGVYGFDDRILGEKAGEGRNARQRQAADHHGDIGQWHDRLQSAHLAHVLLVMHGDDDRTRPEEQQRLEKSVGTEMENRHRVGRRTQRHGHISQLRQGRISHHALDIVLYQADQRHEDRGGRTDHQHH